MNQKEKWIKLAKEASNHYLNLGDNGFDETMKVKLVDCNYEEQSATYEFATQGWQINERGGIHGGAIAGMFDTGIGVVANFTAGPGEATTTDLNINFLRTFELGETGLMKVYIVKAGRKLIRLKADLFCKETGKLIATATGNWMPL